MLGDNQWPSLPRDRVATGEAHQVAHDELFFSTTDLLGVITGANPVFVRLARFGYRELLGAPHNIIRHPDMPGGAFKLMWDTLKAGKPFCAYVDNLASGGSTYSVFATITPLGNDAYLSVRCRPQRTDLKTAAASLYRAAQAREVDARSRGASARQAAEVGLETLAAGLAGAGFPSYEDFMNLALPAEVEVRLTQPVPVRPSATGAAAEVLIAANDLAERLHDWAVHQGRLSDVARHVQEAIPQLRGSMDDALATAKSLAATMNGDFVPLLVWIDLWARMMGAIDPVLVELTDALTELRTSCLRTAFRLSLAILHTETVAQFAVELIDGVTVPDYDEDARTTAMDALGQALEEGFAATREQDAHNAEMAAAACEQLDFVRELMGIPQQLITSWQQMATAGTHEVVDKILPVMSEQMRKAEGTLALLEQLREAVSTISKSASSDQVNRALDRVLRAMGNEEPLPPRRAMPAPEYDDDEDEASAGRPVVASRSFVR